MKSSTDQLVSTVQREITFFNSPDSVRVSIGDSIFNNRVPSVRQVIRYLNGTVFAEQVGRQLEVVYTLLRSKGLFNKVRRNKCRSDAYDINEFFDVVNRYVNRNPSLKGQVSKTINNVI